MHRIGNCIIKRRFLYNKTFFVTKMVIICLLKYFRDNGEIENIKILDRKCFKKRKIFFREMIDTACFLDLPTEMFRKNCLNINFKFLDVDNINNVNRLNIGKIKNRILKKTSSEFSFIAENRLGKKNSQVGDGNPYDNSEKLIKDNLWKIFNSKMVESKEKIYRNADILEKNRKIFVHKDDIEHTKSIVFNLNKIMKNLSKLFAF
jgi:hypothetical protein